MKRKPNEQSNISSIDHSYFEKFNHSFDLKCLGCISYFTQMQRVCLMSTDQKFVIMNIRKFLHQQQIKLLAKIICGLLNSGGGFIFAIAGKCQSQTQTYLVQGIQLDKKEYEAAFISILKQISPIEAKNYVKMEYLEVRNNQQTIVAVSKSSPIKYVIRIKVTPKEMNGYYYLENLDVNGKQLSTHNKYYIDEQKKVGKITMKDVKVQYIMLEINNQSRIKGFTSSHEGVKCYKPSVQYVRNESKLKKDNFNETNPKVKNC